MQKARGFTLMELMFVIAITAMLGSAIIPQLMTKAEVRRAEKTAEEMRSWLEAGLAYYAANNAWPADANTLVTNQYMPVSALTNPWGYSYTLAVVGNQLQVSTTFEKHPNIGVEKLPLSSATGNVVSAASTVPGTESSHSRLLNRYGDNGQNLMQATLDMGGFAVDNATAINVQSGTTLNINNGHTRANQGITAISANGSTVGIDVRDSGGGANTAQRSFEGSISVNDIYLRSIAGEQWLSSRLPNLVHKGSYNVSNGTVITKPSCPGGGIPRIYLTLGVQQFVDTNTNNWAATAPLVNDLGGSWQMDFRVYWWDGSSADDRSRLLAQTYCYYAV